MSGNEIPDNIQGCQSQIGSGARPVFNNNAWVSTQKQDGVTMAFKSNNCEDPEQANGMQPVQTHFGFNPIRKTELTRNQPRNKQLNLKGNNSIQAEFQVDSFISGSHSLMQRSNHTFQSQQRNLEISESAQVPVNFHFPGGQHITKSQCPGISQAPPIQTQRIDDMPLWQQQSINKQIEMQQQQSSLSQPSDVGRPVVLNGMLINSATRNIWSNELTMSLPQNNDSAQCTGSSGQRSMESVSQQPGEYLYETPIQQGFQGNFQQANNFSPSVQVQELEHVQSNDSLSAFSTNHCGSWSALMQEAADASNSDTVLNEEWSGLSFQKMEMPSGNLQNSSFLNSELLPLLGNANTSMNCQVNKPNLQLPINFSPEPHEEVSAYSFGESVQQFSKEATDKPFDLSHQQTQFNNISDGDWTGQTYEQPASSSHSSEVEFNSRNIQLDGPNHQRMHLQNHQANKLNESNSQPLGTTGVNASKFYDNDNEEPFLKNESTLGMEGDHIGSLWKVSRNQAPISFPSSTGRKTMDRSDGDNLVQNEGKLAAIFSSLNVHNTNHQILSGVQADYGKHANAFINEKEETSLEHQKLSSVGSEVVLNEGFVSSNSQPSQNSEVGGNRARTFNSSLMSSSQTAQKTMGPCSFQSHPMRNLEMAIESVDSKNHTSHSQINANAEEGMHHTCTFPDQSAMSTIDATSALDGSTRFSQNKSKNTGLASQKMLELLHKVDQSRVGKGIERFGLDEQNASSGGADGDACDGSRSSGFGIKLAPPSQRQSLSSQDLSSQISLQTTNEFNERNLYLTQREDQTGPSFSLVHSQKENPADKSVLTGEGKETMYLNFHGNSRMNPSPHVGSSTKSPNVWTSVSSQQCLSGIHPNSNVIMSVSPSPPHKPDDHNRRKAETSFGFGACTTNFQQFDFGKDFAAITPTNVVSSSSDTGIKGLTLESSDLQKVNNYSLFHQMQAMKGADSDPSSRVVKRLKGGDFGNSTSHNISLPSDYKMLSFSSRNGGERSANSSLAFQNLSNYKINDLQNHQLHGKSSLLPSVLGNQRSLIGPQKAPSWSDKFGNFCDSLVHTLPEQRTNHIGNMQQSTSPAVSSHHSVTNHPPTVLNDSNMSMIPKKRKTATSDLLPWYKEVTQGSRTLQSISVMEQKWALATNRVIAKLEEGFDIKGKDQAISRSRRRLILSTQLMQQILPPVPTTYLITDAATLHESVTYFMAKFVLGDACALASSSRNHSCVSSDSENMISGTLGGSEKDHFSRFVEDVSRRSKNMEDGFLRLDKRASILDVKLQCQDLEKASLMHRFSKYYGHAQIEGVQISPTSEIACWRSFVQRHVTVCAMPRDLPQGAKCHTL